MITLQEAISQPCALISVFNTPAPPESEDCLYLNIFAPAWASPVDTVEKVPVMFWIYVRWYFLHHKERESVVELDTSTSSMSLEGEANDKYSGIREGTSNLATGVCPPTTDPPLQPIKES